MEYQNERTRSASLSRQGPLLALVIVIVLVLVLALRIRPSSVSAPSTGISRRADAVDHAFGGRCAGRFDIAVASLARPDAGFINGENLTVDAGWNA